MLLAKFNNVEIHKITEHNFEVRVIRFTQKDKRWSFPDGKKMFVAKGSRLEPTNKDWGRYGYTYMTLESAIAKASELVA